MVKKLEEIFSNKLLAAAAIVFLSIIVYCNSFQAPFTLDDFSSIDNNYAIRNPLDVASIWKFYSNRFILYFTVSVNYALHQGNVEGYHAVNLSIHIINGILVYLILRSILGLDYFKKRLTGKYQNTISALSALLFVSHPVQVNAVTYVIQRTASLAAMFYMLAVLFFILFRTRDKVRYFVFTMIFTLMAMFTKENTITIPFMLALLEGMFFLKDGKTSWTKRLSFLFVIFMTIPIIPCTNLYFGGHSMSDPGVSFKASTSMDRFHYFYTELNVMIDYIKILFIPDHLVFDYSNDFPISKTIWENYSYISFVVLGLIGLAGILNIKRNKLLSLGILWFFIGLSVESSFISIKDVYFEHRLYFPMAGFIMALTGLIFNHFRLCGRRLRFRRPLIFFLVCFIPMIVLNSATTLHRNYIFSDCKRLWADVVMKAPGSDRAHCVLATNYVNAYDNDNKKNERYLAMAEEEFKKAISINKDNEVARCNLGKVYVSQKEYEKAIEESKKALSLIKSEYSYHNLGNAYKGLGRLDDAIEAYLSGYKLDNKKTFILKALGNAYYEKGDLKKALGFYEEYMQNATSTGSKEYKDIKGKIDEIKKKI